MRGNIGLLHAVFFASGAAGLGCQIVWTRQFGGGLGHEVPALLAVLAAFFGGFALGAAILSRALAATPRPVRWYAVLEILIGVWTAASAWLIPQANAWCLDVLGLNPGPVRHGLVTFALPFLVLLPATFASGATLPAMERVLAPISRDGRCVGGLYAANTLGAVAGALLGAHALIPTFGYRATLGALAAISVGCGLLMLAWDRCSVETTLRRATLPAVQRASEPISGRRLAATVFATGLLGIGFEIVGVRALAQILEGTVYTFAAVLAVYLNCTALGAAWFQRRLRNHPAQALLTRLLTATASFSLLSLASLLIARTAWQTLHAWLANSVAFVPVSDVALAALVFALPTFCMGAMFSLLAQEARNTRFGVGRAVAWNAAGAALAGIVFGAGLLPALGLKWTFACLAPGYLALRPGHSRTSITWTVAALVLVATLPRDLQLVNLPAGERLLEHREGLPGLVTVSADTNGVRTLRVDGRYQMGSTAAVLPQRREAHLPLLLHPQPRRALFLGPGTGITPGAALDYPGLRVDGAELVPEVVAVMPRFSPENRDVSGDPRARITVADARRFVRAAKESYDVIVADVFHPARDGAGALYSLEHFQAVRRRLAPGGLFCQWLPLHQLDEPTLRSITRTFLEVFPEAHACLLQFNVDIPVLGLIGNENDAPLRLSVGRIEERAASTALRQPLRDVALNDTLKVLGTFVAGPESLRQWAGGSPINTDDRPFVAFSAPRATASGRRTGGALLLSLLDVWREDFTQLVGTDTAELADRVRSYAAARNVYLRGLQREADGELAKAIDLYLESAKASLHFTPAYARCVSIIGVMARADPTAARQLWQRLDAAQPAQPLGRQILEPLLGPLTHAPPARPPQ